MCFLAGGFSYADVLDSAKGWAATIRFNDKVLKQFQEFYNRPDTFSLGICNGCQLMALLGWVPATAAAEGGVAAQLPDSQQPRFVHNTSGRYLSMLSSCSHCQSSAFCVALGCAMQYPNSAHSVPAAQPLPTCLSMKYTPLNHFPARFCLCRFESRYIQVNISDDNPSIWLKGMGGSTVGVWAAHGEGQVLFPDAAVQAAVLDSKLAPIRWV